MSTCRADASVRPPRSTTTLQTIIARSPTTPNATNTRFARDRNSCTARSTPRRATVFLLSHWPAAQPSERDEREERDRRRGRFRRVAAAPAGGIGIVQTIGRGRVAGIRLARIVHGARVVARDPRVG